MHARQTAPQRREFLLSSASGLGGLALTSLLARDGLLAAPSDPGANPLAAKPPPFAPTAKACIFMLLEGGPSQMDLYDPKPELQKRHHQPLPKSMTENVRFAFIKKDSAVLLGSPRKFKKHGECGMDLSDFLPHLATCANDIALIRSMQTDSFNHHPGQLTLTTGVPRFGRPTFGAWLTYGLGSETDDLPAYVVLTAGRGGSGGVSNWSSGFLPSTYQGVLFRGQGDPVLNLSNPPGVTDEMQRLQLEAIRKLNRQRYELLHDPETASRITAYELAFKMQAAAPELIDISRETQETLDLYGVTRPEPKPVGRGGGADVYRRFATNCLLARRLVERGVRFVTLIHASWDQHSHLDPELAYNAGMLDQPAAGLIKHRPKN